MGSRFAYIAVYIMASRHSGTLYVGVTSDLPRRVFEHREKARKGFTSDHGVTRLVWYEPHDLMVEAIRREKALKSWNRDWKIALIERDNPNWADLYPTLV